MKLTAAMIRGNSHIFPSKKGIMQRGASQQKMQLPLEPAQGEFVFDYPFSELMVRK